MPRKIVLIGIVFLVIITTGAFDSAVQPPAVSQTARLDGDDANTTLRFEEVAASTGLVYESTDTQGGTQGMISDVGVYVADINNDGWMDLLVTGGQNPALFENTGGHFQRSGALPNLTRSIRSGLFVDYNTDGWTDLLLLSDDHPPLLLKNNNGSFERVAAGFDRQFTVPIGATTADYNRDGCPDLFIIQNGQWDVRPPLGLQNISVPLDADNGGPNVLFRGTCSGFEQVNRTEIRGTRWSLATSFVDLTGDGWPDIHVANDFNHDIVYINQHNGTFDRVVLSNQTDRNGMSSEIADVTHDGRLDIFTGNIYYPQLIKEIVPRGQAARANGNTLLVNKGNGTFVDRASTFGVRKGGWAWAAVIGDFDNDMDQDLFHATQRMAFDYRNPRLSLQPEDTEYLRAKFPVYRYPFFAERDGTTFVRRNASTLGFQVTDGRGVARLDYDHDGDNDLVVANAGGKFRLYRNTGQTGTSLQIVLRGADGTLPLGARVSVTTGNTTQVRQYHARTDFLSQDSRTLHFGTGTYARADLHVQWPDGPSQTFQNITTNQRLVITPDGLVAVNEMRRSNQ